MVERLGAPSKPRSQAINIFMGSFPEDRCGIVGQPECLVSISTVESPSREQADQ